MPTSPAALGTGGVPAVPAPGPVLSIDVQLALGALSLRLRLSSAARRIAICGPSGAGKSSGLRVLAGLERRARGRVVALGEPWQDDARGLFVPPWRRAVGWVPQDAHLLPHRSVRDNLRWGAPEGEGVAEIARLLAIEGLLDRRPRNLSGGERQRVALGRALLCRPRLLLLDEPLSALDRAHRGRVAEVIAEVTRRQALPLVLVSHDERDVASLCDEVWEMDEGVLRRTA